MLAPPVPPSMIVPNQMHMETQVAQVTMITQMSLRTGFPLSFFFTLKLIFVLPGMFRNTLSIKKELAGRYLTRSPPSGPVNGAPRRPTSSRRDQHHQLLVPPATNARVQNIPPKGHPPAQTATQPTTAGGGKNRFQA